MSAGQGETVARNYAETLLTLGRRAQDAAGWGTMLRQIANAIAEDVTLYRFLDSPRVAAEQKSLVLSRALSDRVPRIFLKFVVTLVHNRRQMLIPQIASEYETLLDASNGIVHARVTVAREIGSEERESIAAQLSKVVGKTVVPHMAIDPSILGGVVVRMGDTVMDGSLRRRLGTLRRRMMVRPVG